MRADQPGMMWTEDVAAELGVSVRTVRRMQSLARKAAREGATTPRHLPPPADVVERAVWNGRCHVTVLSPRWWAADIGKFKAGRPGHGAPGATGDGRATGARWPEKSAAAN